MTSRIFIALSVLIVMFMVQTARAGDLSLRIGTKNSGAMSYKENNVWVGFDWDMFSWMIDQKLINIGNDTVSNYTIVETATSNSAGFAALANDEFDVWLASPTKTAAREAIVDFTHTYFKTGLRIITHSDITAGSFITQWLAAVFTPEVVFIFVLVTVVILVVATLVWMLEMLDTKQEKKYFDVGVLGIVQAVAWAVNTILSPAYQKKPRHAGSRALQTVLARANLFVVALVTAVFTAATITAPASGITSKDSLAGHLVAIVPGSTAAQWVNNQGDIPTQTYKSTTDAFTGFMNKEVEAFVYDAPRILWWAKEQAAAGNRSYIVLKDQFEPQDYGMVTKEGNNAVMEGINRAVLNFVTDPLYDTYYHKWFALSTTNTTETFSWTADHISGIVLAPVLAIILAIVIRTKFLKTDLAEETMRNLGQEIRTSKIDNVGNNDIGFILSRMVNNQALLLRYSYLLTHRDRFYADQPITRRQIDEVVAKVRQSGSDFMDRVIKQEHVLPPERAATIKNGPDMVMDAIALASGHVGDGIVAEQINISAPPERPKSHPDEGIEMQPVVIEEEVQAPSHGVQETLRDRAIAITDEQREVSPTSIPSFRRRELDVHVDIGEKEQYPDWKAF